MRVANRTNLSVEALDSLAAQVPDFGTLMEYVGWGRSLEPPVLPVEAVAMDEYTHDVIFPLRNGLMIVFGST